MSKTYIPRRLRNLVRKRANYCCEYCGLSESLDFPTHEIDHIIAEKHGGLTKAENLALACIFCNKRKGSDLTSIDPQTGAIVALFHPRRDQWREHFAQRDGRIEPLTATGRVTARLLQFNLDERIAERKLLQQAGLYDNQ